MILTEMEAKVYEVIKENAQWVECEMKLNMNTRKLTSICQRLVTFNLLKKVKTRHYEAIPATYEIKTDREVRRYRKRTIESISTAIVSEIPSEAALYIIGHYSTMRRNQILVKLQEAGYRIGKFALNQFIVDNEIDKLGMKNTYMRNVV